MTQLDETHDPDLLSWVESANAPDTDFPIQNLPFGIFRRANDGPARVGVAIGDHILDVFACAAAGVLSRDSAAAAAVCADPSLNRLMSLGRAPARALRRALSAFLRGDSTPRRMADAVAAGLLTPMQGTTLELPARIGDYTDFYASIHHATNVGSMFRPDNPLLPNYKWVPIGYHGRASSIGVSGMQVQRPWGQTRDGAEGAPTFAPTRRLDYELEIGMFVGQGNERGCRVPIADSEQHMFGLCLLNDWSARDVQTWEYQPLGPFLAKNFATTISPWVVTLDALAPFRAPAYVRPADDPQPLAHLLSPGDVDGGAFDVALEVLLTSAAMREQNVPPFRVSVGSFTDMYWTFAQLVAHHASNGCNLQPGDLLASGTVSGAAKESRGCLLERTWRGSEPLELPTGEPRAFLADGDEVTFRGYCMRHGFRRIGFGECVGRVVAPAAGSY